MHGKACCFPQLAVSILRFHALLATLRPGRVVRSPGPARRSQGRRPGAQLARAQACGSGAPHTAAALPAKPCARDQRA